MTTRSLIASAAAAFLAGALLSSGAVAATPAGDVTKVTAAKADQTILQFAQADEKKSKGKKGKKGKKKKGKGKKKS